MKVADSAAPLNFLSEPDPVNGIVVESATSPVILNPPDPKCCRLNNTYASPRTLNSPPETAPIDIDSAAPENANRLPNPISVAGVNDSFARLPRILVNPDPK